MQVLPPFENTVIPEKDLECLICQKPMPMLVQVYCPSDQNPYQDRIIYLFGCTEQKCQAQGSSRWYVSRQSQGKRNPPQSSASSWETNQGKHHLLNSVRGFKSWKFNEEYYRQSSAQQTRSSHPQTALDNQSDLGDNPFKMVRNSPFFFFFFSINTKEIYRGYPAPRHNFFAFDHWTKVFLGPPYLTIEHSQLVRSIVW
jgi:hypothetical protein